MSEPFDPESMPELLDKIEIDRQVYAAAWQDLSEEDMTRNPGAQEDWSIKDQIAHIVWWESYMLDVLTLLAAGQDVPRIKDYDALNARVWARHADLPLDYVLESFAANWPRIQAMLRSLTLDDIYADGGRMLGWIEADSFGHYAEHLPDLVRYTESLKA
jgi:hypothetical protein